MKRIFLIAYSLLCLATLHHAQAGEQPSVNVKTYGQHIGGNIVYTYLVTNLAPIPLPSVNIGCRCRNVGDPKVPDEGPQLKVFPVNYDLEKELTSDGSYSAPTGWYGLVAQYEDTGNISFEFSAPTGEGLALRPGQMATFRIIVPEQDLAYLTSYFSYHDYDTDGKFKRLSFPMQLIDKTPPSISLTLAPASIWPPNGKQVKVTANVSTKDDYDPNPVVKLESVTANEPLSAEDVVARIGEDARSFSVAARRGGQAKEGRVYTVTYSATDASGNKAIASAIVTVPHDRR